MSTSGYVPVSIYIDKLWVSKGGGLLSRSQTILQDINFYVKPGNFVAVIGPNGAGKTTLLKAIIGERPARGRILLHMGAAPKEDHENLYDNPEYWMRQIGYVPVDNVLHEDLTIRQALLHVGKLRLPMLNEEMIAQRVQEKLEGLGFFKDDSRFDQFIKTLSSGERKRVNIAAELLTNPPLLLLDEPTSNLDPNAERDLMDSLSSLSGSANDGNGPTILLITHTLSTIDRCSQAVFIANSRMEIEGTPELVFNHLENGLSSGQLSTHQDTFEHWAAIFDAHKTEQAIANRDRALPPPQTYPQAPARHVTPSTLWQQLRVLSVRYFLIRLNDFGGIPVILISGFMAGFLLLIAPPDIFKEAEDATPARQAVVLYTILIVIVGTFLSHREVSKEFRIYLHERSKGLLPIAYLLSKVLWLSVVVGVFVSGIILALSGLTLSRWLILGCGIVLLGVGILQFVRGRTKPSQVIVRTVLVVLPFIGAYFVQLQNKEIPDIPLAVTQAEAYIIITYILTCIAAVTLGIMVSAFVGNNNDRATQLAIAVILINVILAFSALMITTKDFQWLFDTLEPVAASHWGYRGFSSSLGIYCWAGQYRMENFNSYGHIIATWVFLASQTVIFLAFATFALRLQETWFTRTEQFSSVIKNKSTWGFVVVSITLLSWGIFLVNQSDSYFKLTYYDVLYGGTRYAQIQSIDKTTSMQDIIGEVSQSACGKHDATSNQTAMQREGLFVPSFIYELRKE